MKRVRVCILVLVPKLLIYESDIVLAAVADDEDSGRINHAHS